MNLCIDIGNSKSKIALFSGDTIEQYWSRKSISLEWIESILDEYPVKASIISNTRSQHQPIREKLAEATHFIPLDHNTPLPIKIDYSTPETLGRDRIAVVCEAYYLHPGKNVLVIDAGTCITMDAISKDGDYYGGSIHPGLTMRFKALNNYTGKLPLVKKQKVNSLIGDSTEQSILVGVAYATVREMEGMVSDYKVKYGELIVIITGGDAGFFVSQMKSKIFAHSNLVLSGLNKILKYNVEKL